MSSFSDNIEPIDVQNAVANVNSSEKKLIDLFDPSFWKGANYWVISLEYSNNNGTFVRYSKCGPMGAKRGQIAILRTVPSSTQRYADIIIENPSILETTYLRGSSATNVSVSGQSFLTS